MHSVQSLSLYIETFNNCFNRLLPPTHPSPHSLETLSIVIYGLKLRDLPLSSVSDVLAVDLKEIGRLVLEREVPKLVLELTMVPDVRWDIEEFEEVARKHLGPEVVEGGCEVLVKWGSA